MPNGALQKSSLDCVVMFLLFELEYEVVLARIKESDYDYYCSLSMDDGKGERARNSRIAASHN